MYRELVVPASDHRKLTECMGQTVMVGKWTFVRGEVVERMLVVTVSSRKSSLMSARKKPATQMAPITTKIQKILLGKDSSDLAFIIC